MNTNAKSSHRQQKVERELREILGRSLLQTPVGDAFVTITRVTITGDLREAKVYFTAFSPSQQGDMAKDKELLESLREKAYQLQRTIAQQLSMKFTPKLKFFYDEGFYNSLGVENQIRGLATATSDEEE